MIKPNFSFDEFDQAMRTECDKGERAKEKVVEKDEAEIYQNQMRKDRVFIHVPLHICEQGNFVDSTSSLFFVLKAMVQFYKQPAFVIERYPGRKRGET